MNIDLLEKDMDKIENDYNYFLYTELLREYEKEY